MVGFQEAREVAGMHAKGLIVAMVSAFAVGQIAGPVCVSYVARANGDFSEALVFASLLLLVSAWTLFHRRRYGNGEARARRLSLGGAPR